MVGQVPLQGLTMDGASGNPNMAFLNQRINIFDYGVMGQQACSSNKPEIPITNLLQQPACVYGKMDFQISEGTP